MRRVLNRPENAEGARNGAVRGRRINHHYKERGVFAGVDCRDKRHSASMPYGHTADEAN